MTRVRQIIAIVLVLGVFSLSIWAISNELRDYSPKEIWSELGNISRNRKLGAVALTMAGYLAMTGYDWLGFCYIRYPLALGKIIQTSFISYAVGNTVGFTILSGTAIRYRFYAGWGVSNLNIAREILFTHLSFWLGIFAIGGVVFLVDPLTIPDTLNNRIKLPFNSIHHLGYLFLLIILIYIAFGFVDKQPIRFRGEEFEFPPIELSLGLIIFSALDWGLASGVLYLLLPPHISLSYVSFFGIYILGLTAGIISTVPGGLGVFETVIMFMRPSEVSAPELLGALIAYRGIYYFLPFTIALLMLLIHEIKQKYRSS